MKKNEQPQKLGDDIEYIDVHVMGISEKRREKKRKEKISEERVAKIFPNLIENLAKSSINSSGTNTKRFKPRHIIVDLLRIQGKKKISDVARK